MSMLLLFSIAKANWPDSACAGQPSQTEMCMAFCQWKDCAYDHWCSCGSCLPMSYCMTACTFITCSSSNCCNCGYCYSTSSVTNASQANETNVTSSMFSGSYWSDCGESCNITNAFCFQDQCYASEKCDGKCHDVQDCDTCFCGVCLDHDDVETDQTVTNTMYYRPADSQKHPDTFLACLVLTAVALIGVIGLLVVRIYKPKYKQIGSSIEQTAVCVKPREIDVQTREEKLDMFF